MFTRATHGEKTGRNGRIAVRVVAASIVLIGLAGCRPQYGDSFVVGQVLPDTAQRHPIMVSQMPVDLEVRAARGSTGLSPSQRAEVQSFIGQYRTDGTGKLMISTPSGGSNEGAAFHTMSEIRHVVRASGIPDHAVSVSPYRSSGGSQPPVKLSFVRYHAQGPECGRWPENLAKDDRNVGYHNFGCAQQRNLAAMVSNPRDLIVPRTMDPRSSERRDTVWGKYVTGQPTGAEKSSDEKAGNISDVAKN